VDDAEDGVGANKVPGIDRRAASGGIPRKAERLNGLEAAIDEAGPGRAAIELGLVNVDALFIFSRGAGRERVWGAGAGGDAVAGGKGRSVKRTVVGDVVVNAHGAGCRARDDGHEAGEGVGWAGGAGGDVVDSGLADGGEVRAVGLATVDAGDTLSAVLEVYGVHAVDAQQEHVFDLSVLLGLVLSATDDPGQRRGC